MKKRILASFLACSMAASMAACGNSPGDSAAEAVSDVVTAFSKSETNAASTVTASADMVNEGQDADTVDDAEEEMFSESGLDFAFDLHTFAELGPWTEDNDVTIDDLSMDDCLLIEDVNGLQDVATFYMDETFDFGDGQVDRLEIDALAQDGSEVEMKFYLDDEKEPFAELLLNEDEGSEKQSASETATETKTDTAAETDTATEAETDTAAEIDITDVSETEAIAASETMSASETEASTAQWSAVKSLVVDLSDQGITGSHKVHFTLENVKDEAEEQDSDLNNKKDEDSGKGEEVAVLLRTMQFIESSIPVMYFNIDESQGTIEEMNSDPNHAAMCYGDVSITVPEGYKSEYDEDGSFEGGTFPLDYIRGRGNSSWMNFDKKPYKLKFDENVNLFGMGQNKHWALLSGGEDHTMLVNRFTYHLADEIGLDYSIKCLNVDVYMNGSYMGNYLLSEQVRIDENRLELDNLMDDYDENMITDLELTGGYLLGMQNNTVSKDQYSFVTEHGGKFTVVEPESDADFVYDKANQYIETYMQRIEHAIFGEPNEEGVVEDVWDLMDLESTAKYFLLQYVSDNSDAYNTSSTYMYKARDVENADGTITESKLYWGPIWDFDLGWCQSMESEEPEDVIIQQPWINYMLKYNDTFKQALRQYWPEVREGLMEIASDDGLIDSYVEEMLPSVIHNYQVNPWASMYDAFEGATDEEEDTSDKQGLVIKDYYLQMIEAEKTWILAHVDWMDENVDHLRAAYATVKYMSEGEIFYQTDESFDAIRDYPEEIPVSKDPNKVFTGWTVESNPNYLESDDTEMAFSPNCSPISCKLDPTYDGYELIVTANFADADQVVIPTELTFEQDVYEYSLSKDADKFSDFRINYSYAPENATETTFAWSVSDPELCIIVDYPEEHYLSVYLNAACDVTITGRACDGQKYQCRVHITE